MKIFKTNQNFIKIFINSSVFLVILLLNVSCEKKKYSNHKIDDNLIMFLKNNKDEANFIAHAGGGINSDTYTNSIEALEKSIQNGFKFIEIDLMETSDDFFVGVHDWPTFKKKIFNYKYEIDKKPMTLNQVKNSKINNNYKPLTINYINEIFNKNESLYLITDKTNNFKKIISDFTFDQSRIIVEIFGRDNYFLSIKEGIINPMFSASISDYDFILKNNIQLIAIHSEDLIRNKEKYEKLIKKNVFIFVYSTNNKKFIEEHLDISVSGFYTDFWDLDKNICDNDTCITY